MQFSTHEDVLGRQMSENSRGEFFLTHSVHLILIRNEASNWGNWAVIYLCIQTVRTYNDMEYVLQGCGDACGVVLHCKLFFAWP